MNKVQVIYRVLIGEATDVEKEGLRAWIGHSDANRREYEDLRLLWQRSRGTKGNVKEAGFYEGLERIRIMARARFRRKARSRRAIRLLLTLGCAALAVFIAVHAVQDFQPNLLRFDDVALQQVLPAIERAYGIEVRVEEDALRACRFTGIFYMVDEPDAVIRSISDAISAELVATAPGKYRLKGAGC